MAEAKPRRDATAGSSYAQLMQSMNEQVVMLLLQDCKCLTSCMATILIWLATMPQPPHQLAVHSSITSLLDECLKQKINHVLRHALP